MSMLKAVIERFQSDESGQGLVEYVLIIALIAIGLTAIMLVMRNSIGNTFKNISDYAGQRSGSAVRTAADAEADSVPGGPSRPPVRDPSGLRGGPMDPASITTVAFVALMGTAAVWDVTRRKIPNLLVLAGLTGALALRALGGWPPLGAGLAGAGLAFVITFPFFLLRGMGGGDVKLFVAVGAFMGPAGFFAALLASAIIGGVLGLVLAIRRGVLLPDASQREGSGGERRNSGEGGRADDARHAGCADRALRRGDCPRLSRGLVSTVWWCAMVTRRIRMIMLEAGESGMKVRRSWSSR